MNDKNNVIPFPGRYHPNEQNIESEDHSKSEQDKLHEENSESHEKHIRETYQMEQQGDKLREWYEGLLNPSYESQWKLFEQLGALTDIATIKLLEQFMLYKQGDLVLKTKILQSLKQQCPWPLPFTIYKNGQEKEIKLTDVPLVFSDWPEPYLLVYYELEGAAYDDPSLLEMAKELWQYALEKHYPFMPTITNHLQWTAGLHYYTLSVINEDMAHYLLEETLVSTYDFTKEEIVAFKQNFEQLLLKL